MAQVPGAIALLAELRGALRLGRPKGSGIYPTADDFLQVVVPIIRQLKEDGIYPSQWAVVERWPSDTSVKQLQRWFNQYIGTYTQQSWADFVKSSDLLSF